jgi:hypothetical protein
MRGDNGKINRLSPILASGFIFLVAASSGADENRPDRKALRVPDDFPRFIVPGHERRMALLRELFWLHYPGLFMAASQPEA